MTFGYVSSKNQILSADEQRFKIEEWSRANKITVDKIIRDEQLLMEVRKNDVLIVDNIGVFGSSVKNALEQISEFLKNEIKIYCVGWENSLEGKEMARAFSIALETFNSIVLNSTKVGLNRARNEGRIGGRKPGQKPCKTKLSGHEDEIRALLAQGVSKSELSRKFKVAWNTVDYFIKEKNLR